MQPGHLQGSLSPHKPARPTHTHTVRPSQASALDQPPHPPPPGTLGSESRTQTAVGDSRSDLRALRLLSPAWMAIPRVADVAALRL